MFFWMILMKIFQLNLKKFDLIGIPYQIILGKKSDADLIEFKEINNSSKNLSIDEIIKILTINKNSN